MKNKSKIISLLVAGFALGALPAMASEPAKMHDKNGDHHMKKMMMHNDGKHNYSAMHKGSMLGKIMHSKEYAEMSDEDRASMDAVVAGVVKKWLPQITPKEKGDCPAMGGK